MTQERRLLKTEQEEFIISETLGVLKNSSLKKSLEKLSRISDMSNQIKIPLGKQNNEIIPIIELTIRFHHLHPSYE